MFVGPTSCEYSQKPKFISGIFRIYNGTVPPLLHTLQLPLTWQNSWRNSFLHFGNSLMSFEHPHGTKPSQSLFPPRVSLRTDPSRDVRQGRWRQPFCPLFSCLLWFDVAVKTRLGVAYPQSSKGARNLHIGSTFGFPCLICPYLQVEQLNNQKGQNFV